MWCVGGSIEIIICPMALCHTVRSVSPRLLFAGWPEQCWYWCGPRSHFPSYQTVCTSVHLTMIKLLMSDVIVMVSSGHFSVPITKQLCGSWRFVVLAWKWFEVRCENGQAEFSVYWSVHHVLYIIKRTNSFVTFSRTEKSNNMRGIGWIKRG